MNAQYTAKAGWIALASAAILATSFVLLGAGEAKAHTTWNQGTNVGGTTSVNWNTNHNWYNNGGTNTTWNNNSGTNTTWNHNRNSGSTFPWWLLLNNGLNTGYGGYGGNGGYNSLFPYNHNNNLLYCYQVSANLLLCYYPNSIGTNGIYL
jgi:hypothetical protein